MLLSYYDGILVTSTNVTVDIWPIRGRYCDSVDQSQATQTDRPAPASLAADLNTGQGSVVAWPLGRSDVKQHYIASWWTSKRGLSNCWWCLTRSWNSEIAAVINLLTLRVPETCPVMTRNTQTSASGTRKLRLKRRHQWNRINSR